MKTFWMIIGVLVLATVGVMLLNRTPAKSTPPKPAPTAPMPEQPVTPPPVQALPESAPAPVPTPAASGNPAPPAGHSAYHGGPTPPVTATATGTRPVEKTLPPAATDPVSPKPQETTPSPASSDPAKPAGSEAEKPADKDAPKFTLGPPTEVKEEEDGWTRLDGRFLVRGKGTAEDPLILPWELLVSASESYRPRTGTKEMPRRVADLKGKHVRVTGYVLFPLMTMETTELLLMRNQWDGCCIGVPPTPYDAVEVKLAKPADRKDSFVSFVTLEGVIDVDPYVNRDFLLGLYTMSEAAMIQPAKDKDRGL